MKDSCLNYKFRNKSREILLCLMILWTCFLIQKSYGNVLPAYIWPLAYIYNQTLPITPPMEVYGGVTQETGTGGLRFDGATGWIDAGDFQGQCIAQPKHCTKGLSVGLQLNFDKKSDAKSQELEFIFDSGAVHGEGVSVYVQSNKYHFEVSNGIYRWKASFDLEPNKWHFVLATWNPQSGILVFVDGPLITVESKKSQVQKQQKEKDNSEMQHHITIGKANNDQISTRYGKFVMEMIAVFNEYVPTGRVMLSYTYTKPSNNTKPSNIRYVNVRFVNKNEDGIIVYPDRGKKKTTGYPVNGRTSTFLEFVLKEGPLPYGMDFLVKDNKTNEVLLLAQKQWIHVYASDDSQFLAEINVGKDKLDSITYSTKGVYPNYYFKKELRPGKEYLTKSVSQNTQNGGDNEHSSSEENHDAKPALSPQGNTNEDTASSSFTSYMVDSFLNPIHPQVTVETAAAEARMKCPGSECVVSQEKEPGDDTMGNMQILSAIHGNINANMTFQQQTVSGVDNSVGGGTSTQTGESTGDTSKTEAQPGTTEKTEAGPNQSQTGTGLPSETGTGQSNTGNTPQGTSKKPGQNTEQTGTGQQTPSPGNAGRQTPSPGNAGQQTPSPGNAGQQTQAPGSLDRQTQAPGNGGQQTLPPEMAGQQTQAPWNAGQQTKAPGNVGQQTQVPGNIGQQTNTNAGQTPVKPTTSTHTTISVITGSSTQMIKITPKLISSTTTTQAKTTKAEPAIQTSTPAHSTVSSQPLTQTTKKPLYTTTQGLKQTVATLSSPKTPHPSGPSTKTPYSTFTIDTPKSHPPSPSNTPPPLSSKPGNQAFTTAQASITPYKTTPSKQPEPFITTTLSTALWTQTPQSSSVYTTQKPYPGTASPYQTPSKPSNTYPPTPFPFTSLPTAIFTTQLPQSPQPPITTQTSNDYSIVNRSTC
ncbi:mucin-2-like [Clytia hemisphaerica]|uniref:mucin-2-like n=1 Tax=Clytia hemisphaerica TaxID=252671 RepID=UPI0034D4C53D